jgi:broad specificity phosphatase PhoE
VAKLRVSADSSTLYLVRHGATDANLRQPYILQGRGVDLPLNATGARQAERVAGLLANHPLTVVYSSPMRRALETARAIAGRCGVDVVVREELIECNVGRWEGLSWDGIRERYPAEYENFQRDPSRFPYLEGETYADVARRVVPVLEELLERHRGQQIAVAAHNIVNRCAVATFLGFDLARAKEIHQTNGGVNVVRRQNGRTELITVNSTFHLEDGFATSKRGATP